MNSGSQSHLLLKEVTVNATRGMNLKGITNKWREMNLKALLMDKNKGDPGLNWGSVSRNI